MLTPKQFEAIGRLTLAFNELEDIIEAYYASLLGTPEYSVALAIAEEEFFAKKIEKLRTVAKAYSDAYPESDISKQAKVVFELLSKAQSIGKRRNEYVHAKVMAAGPDGETRLKIKRSIEKTCNELEILALVGEISNLLEPLSHECFELLEAILCARERSAREKK